MNAYTLYIHIIASYVASMCTHKIPYKLWREKNFGEFGESSQFAKFFSPIS